jgi:hypothetical protein
MMPNRTFLVQGIVFLLFSLVGIFPRLLLGEVVGVSVESSAVLVPWRAYGAVAFSFSLFSFLISRSRDSAFLRSASLVALVQFAAIGAYWTFLWTVPTVSIGVHIVHAVLFLYFITAHGIAAFR